MIIDSRLEICDNAALTLAGFATTPVPLGSLIDLTSNLAIGNALKEYPGNSDRAYLCIRVTTTATSAGAATVKFALVSDAQDPVVAATATPHWESPDIPKATLVAGYEVACIPLPRGVYERYLGLVQTVGTADLTAGKVDAYITLTPPSWFAAPDAL